MENYKNNSKDVKKKIEQIKKDMFRVFLSEDEIKKFISVVGLTKNNKNNNIYNEVKGKLQHKYQYTYSQNELKNKNDIFYIKHIEQINDDSKRFIPKYLILDELLKHDYIQGMSDMIYIVYIYLIMIKTPVKDMQSELNKSFSILLDAFFYPMHTTNNDNMNIRLNLIYHLLDGNKLFKNVDSGNIILFLNIVEKGVPMFIGRGPLSNIFKMYIEKGNDVDYKKLMDYLLKMTNNIDPIKVNNKFVLYTINVKLYIMITLILKKTGFTIGNDNELMTYIERSKDSENIYKTLMNDIYEICSDANLELLIKETDKIYNDILQKYNNNLGTFLEFINKYNYEKIIEVPNYSNSNLPIIETKNEKVNLNPYVNKLVKEAREKGIKENKRRIEEFEKIKRKGEEEKIRKNSNDKVLNQLKQNMKKYNINKLANNKDVEKYILSILKSRKDQKLTKKNIKILKKYNMNKKKHDISNKNKKKTLRRKFGNAVRKIFTGSIFRKKSKKINTREINKIRSLKNQTKKNRNRNTSTRPNNTQKLIPKSNKRKPIYETEPPVIKSTKEPIYE
jgi:hypothetical protein